MTQLATFGGGCFWCIEAVFKRVKGVLSVTSGYSGGRRENPTYEQVCSGATGHAEVVQVEFDPSVITYKQLLEIFFHLHDPTTLNKQGADEGTQYRSIIFYHDENQKNISEEVKEEVSKDYRDPIVTEIVPFEAFYKAEANHKDYYDKNRDSGYCRVVIDPKIKKLLKDYKEVIKDPNEKIED